MRSLSELRDNDTIAKSTINKEDVSRIREAGYIREVGKIVRLLLLLLKAANAKTDGIFPAWPFKKGKNRLHALILVHVHDNVLNNFG